MKVFRLCKTRYASGLSGKGAELGGGRWNSKGIAILYTSGTRALATTEIAVRTPMGNIPIDYCMVSIEIPETGIEILDAKQLSKDWKSFPHSDSTQKIGDAFIRENKSLVLKVPAAVVQGEYNYLINPLHPAFSQIKIVETEPFSFDDRLFQ